MIGRDRMRDVLQENCFTRARRRHDQSTLALAERRDDIDDARREILDRRIFDLKLQPLRRIERRQVIKVTLVLGFFGIFEIDVGDFEKGEIALAIFGRANLAFDRISGSECKSADLRGRHVNIIGTGKIVGFRRS